jgi:hypothetical protein
MTTPAPLAQIKTGYACGQCPKMIFYGFCIDFSVKYY